MSIVICADTHTTLDIEKVQEYFRNTKQNFSKKDYLIICGDVGIGWENDTNEKEAREILRNLPVSVLFCDGNHEHIPHLNSYKAEEWNGGVVHVIEPGLIHLMRGQLYTLEGKMFFVFGGACSIDRDYQEEGTSWFREEVPSKEEYEEGWKNLERVNYQVDYIITHTGPYEIVKDMEKTNLEWKGTPEEILEMQEAIKEQGIEFQKMADKVTFTKWYFGHFHEDSCVGQFQCLMEEMVCL
ncbi:MAG: metallophosphoesterase [Eubacteriales bacterium]